MRFKIITNFKKKERNFKNEPPMHLMKSCNDEGCRVMKTIKNRTKERNMVKFGKLTLWINYHVMDRPFGDSVRAIDLMDSENQYLFDKHPLHHDLIESEARNVC